jgi:hypothetical protein
MAAVDKRRRLCSRTISQQDACYHTLTGASPCNTACRAAAYGARGAGAAARRRAQAPFAYAGARHRRPTPRYYPPLSHDRHGQRRGAPIAPHTPPRVARSRHRPVLLQLRAGSCDARAHRTGPQTCCTLFRRGSRLFPPRESDDRKRPVFPQKNQQNRETDQNLVFSRRGSIERKEQTEALPRFVDMPRPAAVALALAAAGLGLAAGKPGGGRAACSMLACLVTARMLSRLPRLPRRA